MIVKKKFAFYLIVGYFIYLGFIYLYLFHFHKSEISPEMVGSSIDPSTFMTEKEHMLAEQYSSIRNFLFFLQIPYEWMFYFFLLLFGWGRRMERYVENTFSFQFVKIGVFSFALSILSLVVFYPIRLASWFFAKTYGISNQSFSYWMKDYLISFWIDFLLLFFIMTVVLYFIRKKGKRWWLYSWFAAIPFALFFMYIQPVVIDPLYNDFTPITDKDLEGEILSLAEEAGVDADHVYEVDMSLKSNALNAYVTGIGENKRIVLWDTVIERLDEEEILFIMAHEIAHYVEKHIYIGIAGYLLLLFLGLFLTAKFMNILIRKFGHILQIERLESLSSFLLVILMISVLSFSGSPLVNMVSRYEEMRADRYAIETVENVDAGISTFQKLAKSGLSQIDPPILVKWFRYGHPTIKERILFVESYRDTFGKEE